ncbi:MAG: HD domain-containing protein [Candidatus Dojkabacteria bacterium]|nr:MAG: HD domain-containing protein [Candidatus Dojkabacteria bacterium]
MQYKILRKFLPLWNLALPLQDKRNDKGHAFLVTIYAQDIAKKEGADLDIVVPAAILHDIGWSKLSEKERMSVFLHDVDPAEKKRIRLSHQEESVFLAVELLNQLDYPPEDSAEILAIISEHDTREGFLHKNDGAMRDADKLWRFDEYGFLSDHLNGVGTLEEDCIDLEKKIEMPGFFCFDSSKRQVHHLLEALKQKFLSS